MKCQIPQISWHSRDPVLSVDFQPGKHDKFRLASGGTDSHVIIWYITYQENKTVKIECASVLSRHNKSVNVVRFSPNGENLASGDDEGGLIVWQLKKERDIVNDLVTKDEEIKNQEDWQILKLLRGHLEDIYDVCWSADGNHLVSASMDNTAIVWDMQKYQKVHIFSEFKGYVQGVTWDPLNVYIAAIGTDRALRILNINTKKTAFNIQRAPWSVTTEKGTTRARLFYDDTLQSYFRRLSFTPDGELLIVPSGILEKDEKLKNAAYIFSRHSLKEPVMHLPTGDKYTVAVRCNPNLYKLRKTEGKENNPKSMIDLPYRMIFAIAACESILLYDTEQLIPFAYVSNIHYTHLTDMTWSSDGTVLVASSSDGYCSFVTFSDGELGEIYIPPPPPPPPEPKEVPQIQEKTEISPKTEEVKLDSVEINKSPAVVTPKVSKSPIELNRSSKKLDTAEAAKSPAASTPKVSKSPMELSKSGKKQPKMLNIKDFFMSPKARPEENRVKSQETVSIVKDTEITTSEDKLKADEIKAAVNNDNSIEIVFESIKVTEPDDSKPKCKTQLSFMDKIASLETSNVSVPSTSGAIPSEKRQFSELGSQEQQPSKTLKPSSNSDDEEYEITLVSGKPKSLGSTPAQINDKDFEFKRPNVPDLDSCNAMSSFTETVSETKIEKMEDSLDDWKLEYSTDSEITPMEIDPAPVKVDTEGLPKEVPKEAPVKENKKEASKVESPSIKPKRRVQLITLSKTTGGTGNV